MSEQPGPIAVPSAGAGLFLLASVFLSGGAVMIVEMTAVRAIAPYFGTTTYVWTNVIAVVLASLAVGYAVGGRLADKRGSLPLFFALLAAGGLLVAVGAAAVTPVCKWLLPEGLDLEGVVGVLMKGSLVATLILFSPPTLLLGTISPLAIRLLSDNGVGRAAGRVFSISTLGSLLGTYLPTLYLVPAVGSRNTLLIAAAMLVAPGAVGLLVFGRAAGRSIAAVAVVFACGIFAITEPRPARGEPVLPEGMKSTVLAEVESEYQYLTVRDDTSADGSTARMLTINEGVYTYHSYRILGKVLTGSKYYDDYARIPVLLDLEPGDTLRGCVVGLAGGVTARQCKHFWGDLYDVEIDGAEIDPDVIKLGREYFFLPDESESWLKAYAMDGRQMLEAVAPERAYDMLVIDAFSQEIYIPFHLATVEFFELCKRRLAPGGVLAMNIYAYRPDSPNLLAIENTLAKVFGKCVRTQQFWGSNAVLFARNGADVPDMTRLALDRINARFGERDLSEWDTLIEGSRWMPSHSRVVTYDPEGLLLTDDHSPLERLMDEMIDQSEREALGKGAGR